MPKDSKRLKRLRKLKRERTIAYRYLQHVAKERDVYKTMAGLLGEELKHPGSIGARAKPPAFTVKQLDEVDGEQEAQVETNPAD